MLMGVLTIIYGRPGGQTMVFLQQFLQLLLYSNFATEFRSYPPLKVIYHPVGFYNSRMSFLWKTHCIIIITYTLYIYTYICAMNTVNRRTWYNGNAETSHSTDLPAPDCLLLQVNRNWSDFLSVKLNPSHLYIHYTHIFRRNTYEWSPRYQKLLSRKRVDRMGNKF